MTTQNNKNKFDYKKIKKVIELATNENITIDKNITDILIESAHNAIKKNK